MKRWITLLLALALTLTACGNNSGESQTEPPKTETATARATTTQAPPPARIQIEKSHDGEQEPPYLLYAPNYEGNYPHIKGKVLYDKGGIRVTMPDCDLKPDFTGFYSIPMVLENETDVNIRMSSFDFSINRKAIITTSGGLFDDAKPHSKVNTSCFFYQSDINKNAQGVAIPVAFEIVLTFFDLDNDTRIGSSDVIFFHSDAGAGYVEKVTPYPVVLWEQKNITVRAGTMYQDKRGNVMLEVSVKNAFKEPMTFTAVDMTINGTPVDQRFVRWVIPGTTDSQELLFSVKDLKKWGLDFDSITELSMKFTCTRHYEEEILAESGLIEIDLVDTADRSGSDLNP